MYQPTGDRSVKQAIVPTNRRLPRQASDRTDKQAIVPTSKVNLKKQGKFCPNGSVTAESDLIGHQKSVKLARPLDFHKSVV
ncbi:hypothetical protein PN499_27095 [Kamptonema animale CS-326]|uniref:hypothetical protein n=1 Tax=Kamptonema animale TaxID=92934 RepID=UPI00232E7B09|nr:hypothetical protein [Kamptonema animale]MDB9514873.1 hypothetical protein [Kamptonema animale CS-326]